MPLAAAFTEFARHYDIDCSGIRLISTGDSEPSRITVRDKLVHGSGSVSSPSFIFALTSATCHLEWSIEIYFLALLGWRRVKTRLELTTLRGHYSLATAEGLLE